GVYRIPRYLDLHTDGVTLRGASGKRENVVLDGGNIGELVGITACSGVTIADLTIQNVRWNGIKINSNRNVQRGTIHNVILHNVWQRGIKGVRATGERPSDFLVQYCLFYNDRPKTYADDPTDNPETFGGNYIGGMDIMNARRWVIRDNVFMGIRGRTGAARGAVFLWMETEDCIVERNIIVDCDSGICLGNSHKPLEVPVHAIRCVVRNNFVTRAPENGILADYTRDCKIVHNTLYDPRSRLGRLIRIVHDNDGLVVANNLLCGPPVRNESTSRVELRGNVERDLGAFLVAPAEGNLRFKAPPPPEAKESVVPFPEVVEDIDRQPRGATPDPGAHQWRPAR
ncbi:MAG: right-handed parallel beta-helix repeat-containing protein, partial [Armatimonadota bacterium]|nr:right-handed parallel beta-helix repeat-containing protein [Armatimonadota bacterium]